MDEQQGQRPRQVTVAAIAVIGGALLLFFSGFDVLNNLQSVDQRERLAEALGSAPGFGLTVDELIGWMHVATLVTGAAAAAAAVLGWFALQRHRGARIGLAAVGVVLLVCAPLSGGVLAAFVVVAIATLWSGPARDWYAGRPIRATAGQPAPGRPAGDGDENRRGEGGRLGDHRLPDGYDIWTGRSRDPSGPAPSSTPPPTQGFGDRPTSSPDLGPGGPAPQQPSAYPSWTTSQQPITAPVPQWPAAHGSEGVDRRPGTVVAACVLTWAFAGVAALAFLVVAGLLVVEPGRLVARITAMPQWQDTGLPASTIQPMLWVAVAFYLAWSLGACLLALLVWQGRSWARVLLVVSAIGAVVLGLFAIPASVAHILACGAVVGLLLGGSANRWFARGPHRHTAGPHRPQPPHQDPPQQRPPRAW